MKPMVFYGFHSPPPLRNLYLIFVSVTKNKLHLYYYHFFDSSKQSHLYAQYTHTHFNTSREVKTNFKSRHTS